MSSLYAQSTALEEILGLIPRVVDDVDKTLGASSCTPHLHLNANISLAPLTDDVHHAITEYTALLDRLQCAVAMLSQCAIKVNESIKIHKRLVSPVTRLPPEILASIFVQALPPMKAVFRVYTYVPEGRSVAVNFAQVCRSWREVALALPTLWNPVFFKLTLESLRNPPPPVEELLRRANKGGAPLTLVLDATEVDLCLFRYERLQEICRGSLASFQGRCSAIEIDIRDSMALAPVLSFLSHTSGLSRLRIMGDIDLPTEPDGPALLHPDKHPTLTDLTLQGFWRPLDIGRIFTPTARWEKLVSLQLITDGFAHSEAPHHVVRKILAASPSLRQLLVRSTADQGLASLQDNVVAPTQTFDVDPSEIITSTSLRTLVLVIYSTHMSSMLLSLLRCPSLHTLVICPFVMLPSLETFLTHAESAERLVVITNFFPVEIAVGKVRNRFPWLDVEVVNNKEGKEWFALPVWYRNREDIAYEV